MANGPVGYGSGLFVFSVDVSKVDVGEARKVGGLQEGGSGEDG